MTTAVTVTDGLLPYAAAGALQGLGASNVTV